VLIDAELGREEYGSIPRNSDREGAVTTSKPKYSMTLF
jgi:hypothetical protein